MEIKTFTSNLSESAPDYELYGEDNPNERLFKYSTFEDAMKDELAPWWYYLYARYYVGGRWPEGEPVIIRKIESAFQYAEDVIKGRWVEAEPIIFQDPYYAYHYASDIIKGRCQEAEPYLVKSNLWASWYARFVTGERWIEAEPVIARGDKYLADKYASYFNLKLVEFTDKKFVEIS